MIDLSRREAALAALGTLALVGPTLALSASAAQADDVAALRALLDAHNKAFTAKNMDGVLATLCPDAVMMGTGPGELWVGQDEIRNAYTHFFEDFDPGKQSFESLWHHGNVGPQGAWLMNVSKVSMTRGSSTTEFGLNSSLVAVKADGKWLIQAMHFSNLTPATQS